jgi:hypothetical protein
VAHRRRCADGGGGGERLGCGSGGDRQVVSGRDRFYRYTQRMRPLVLVLIVVLNLAALVQPISAVTVVPLSFDQLVAASSTVVHGRVTDVRGQWTVDRRGIESLVTVEAQSYLKGMLGDRVTVRVPGGEAGGLVNIVAGAPSFRTGDRVILFLSTRGPSVPVITGTTQGVFRVVTHPASGEAMVVPPVVSAAQAQGPVRRGDRARRPLSLGAFAQAVALSVGSGR